MGVVFEFKPASGFLGARGRMLADGRGTGAIVFLSCVMGSSELNDARSWTVAGQSLSLFWDSRAHCGFRAAMFSVPRAQPRPVYFAFAANCEFGAENRSV